MFSVLPDFAANHLSSPPSGSGCELKGLSNIVSATSTEDLHKCAMQLLNDTSRRVFNKFPDHSRPNPIVFRPYNTELVDSSQRISIGSAGPSHCEEAIDIEPVVTIVVCGHKLRKRSRTMANAASTLLNSRSDINGIYLLSIDSLGYQIGWADASGVALSSLICINSGDSHTLLAYIYSLYNPPRQHTFFDTSIHPSLNSPGNLRWNIDVGQKTYTECTRVFNGGPFGRRTNVFASDGEDFVIIKDAFQDSTRKISESDLLMSIHEEGIVPGVVTIVDSQPVPVELAGESSPSEQKNHRVRQKKKHRLVMGSQGVVFSKAKSVKDLLRATYDVLTIHRWLGKRRRIIHRDPSKNNILMYPKHCNTIKTAQVVADPPHFITNVLNSQTTSTSIDDASCLLIDFDIAAPLPSDTINEEIKPELSRRVGTPMYVSRFIATGDVVAGMLSTQFVPMPELIGGAKDLYFKAYGEATYQMYADSDTTFHRGTFTDGADLDDYPFIQRLDHDAESVYWLLLSSLLRAQPQNSTDDPEALRRLDAEWIKFSNHQIKNTINDTRSSILSNTEQTFARILHPSLKSLAPLLVSLTEQVRPEYAYLKPAPFEDHLHEALCRILLQFIIDLEQDILLDPENLRPVPSASRVDTPESSLSTGSVSQTSSTTNSENSQSTTFTSLWTNHSFAGTKRKSETQGGREGGSKRSKTSQE
ncbi:hypothetical protein ABKN59_008698 [Abortiporus biennis]